MNAAVSVSRLIPSSPERLFDAWVEPASLSMWMRRTGDGATSVVADVRVGGSFTITMSHRGQDVVHSGTYLVIDRPHTLEFTWRSPATHMQDSVVRVTFVTVGDATLVSVRHEDLPDAKSAEQHNDGWADILTRYHLATTKES